MPRFSDQFTAGRAATYIIAASNSRNRHLSDYVCDGTADDVEINAAISAMAASSNDGGSIILLEGTYNTTASIDLVDRRRIDIEGQGPVTIVHSGTDEIINLDGTSGARDTQNHFRNLVLQPGTTTTEAIRIRSGCDYNAFENITIDSLNNNAFRISPSAAFQDDGGAFTSYTTAAMNDTENDVNLLPAVPVVNDAFYIGYTTSTFRHTHIRIDTAGVGTWAITWEYWNGSAWTALSSVVDETAPWDTGTGLRTTTGFAVVGMNSVSWAVPGNWTQISVNGTMAYWVRARVSSFTAITTQPLAGRIIIGTSVNTIGIHLHSHDIAATPDRGNFNNIFKNFNIARIGTGVFIETSGDPSRLNNSVNIFDQITISSVELGVKINGGQANVFHGYDIENNIVNLDLNYAIDTGLFFGWGDASPLGAQTNIPRGRVYAIGGLTPDPISRQSTLWQQIGRRGPVFPTISLVAGGVPSGSDVGNLGLTSVNERGLWYVFNESYPVWPATAHMVGREMHLGTNGWTDNAIGGSGSATILPHALHLNSGGGIDGGRRLAAIAALLVGRTSSVGTIARVDWSLPLFLRFTLLWIGANQAAIGRFQIKNANTEGQLAENGLGLQVTYNGTTMTLTGESYAAARSTVVLTQDISVGHARGFEIGIVHRPANYPSGWTTPQVDFYLHGNLAGSITTAANIPSATESTDDYFNFSIINNGTGTSTDFAISDILVWQGEQA